MAAAAAGAAAAGATALSPAVAIMGLQTLFSLGQTISGNSQKRKAEKAQAKATADYERKLRNIEFVNKLQALQVPTLGAELRERGIARATTGAIEATQEAGAEAVLGGVPRVVTAADAQSAEIAAQLDQMAARRDEAVLREEQRIADQRAGIEREIAGIDLMRAQGAGQAAADSAAQQQAGMYGVASGLGGMAVQLAAAQNPYGTQPVTVTADQVSTATTSGSNASTINPAQQSPAYMQTSPNVSGVTTTFADPMAQSASYMQTLPTSSGINSSITNPAQQSAVGSQFLVTPRADKTTSILPTLQNPITSLVTGGSFLDYVFNPFLPQE
jgi:hypothetical protein